MSEAGWAKAGDDRWRRVDEIDEMHLLFKLDDLFYELHGLTLHVYSGPDRVVDDVWPMGDPSTYDPVVHNFAHVGTYDVSSSSLVEITDEDKAWKWLERYANKVKADR